MALDYGFTGPNLKGKIGVDYDVRVANPYSSTKILNLISLGTNGDTYDRYMVRMEEMW